MTRLGDIADGASLAGIARGESANVVAAKWLVNAVLGISFTGRGWQLASQSLYRGDENLESMAGDGLRWSFDADANLMRLTSEAYRISLAHIFDPYLAVHVSAIEPLPHQISAVYQEMLPRLPLRFVLADDPGAGKTIMTGLLLKELIVRGDLRRCMIVTPGNLAEQWQDELYRKFGLRFDILTNDRIASAATGNVFAEAGHCIARLDKLSRDEELQRKLRATDWDLIVCDEAHKMSATVFGGETRHTKRFQLGRLLSSITRHFLLLTATPHNGKEEDFQLFMSLIDQDLFEGVAGRAKRGLDVSGVMRRLVKEDLLKFDGTPLFPERRASSVSYELSPLEARLYSDVTGYVREEFNRADHLRGKRRATVGFALTVLQRRLASSPEAIGQSLTRRRERLGNRLNGERLGNGGDGLASLDYPVPYYDDCDDEDMPSGEMEELEDDVADQASAARTIQELEAEIATLRKLERLASEVRRSGEDRKWEELSKLLQDDDAMIGGEGFRAKLIIFTEHRDTLRYLADRIRSLLGSYDAVVTIHGGMSRNERRKVEELFRQDRTARILIATDAAGEGINLQCAHLMVNYDLPWNPNRLEQRFGRIHRIGQTEVCHLWNLVSRDTREGLVFHRLFEKMEQARDTLRGKVFDVLGKVSFEDKPLRDLLIEAVRYGNDPIVRDRLGLVVDQSLNPSELRKLLDERALTEDAMDVRKVTLIREDMERMAAHRLQPYFIEMFFMEAFQSLGGKIRPREKGRFEITSVPLAVRKRDTRSCPGQPILCRYERVCFDKAYCEIQGKKPASLIAPGHPLLEATTDLVRDSNIDVLRRGAVFVDDSDIGTDARLLFYIESSVHDGVRMPDGSWRVISRRLHFVTIKEDGVAENAGYAPYLDYRAPDGGELDAVRQFIDGQRWLRAKVEDMAVSHAIGGSVPAHVNEVRERRTRLIDRTMRAVEERLTAAVQYWDFLAGELKRKEATGKANARQNSQMAARRAGELEARKHKRLAELENEKLISPMPPVIVGGAVVIPGGLLDKLMGTADTFAADAAARREIELSAMDAVMEIEKSLGHLPLDVSALKVGYDVESTIPSDKRGPDGASLRFIEVKGRASGAGTVTITKNEILTALNKPGEYILALVEVDGTSAKTAYLKRPFSEHLDFAATSVNYGIRELMGQAEVVLRRSKE